MENGKKFYVSQVDDFKHVDSTGAGDAFLAGFIYGLYHEKSFEDSIKSAILQAENVLPALVA